MSEHNRPSFRTNTTIALHVRDVHTSTLHHLWEKKIKATQSGTLTHGLSIRVLLSLVYITVDPRKPF